MLPRRPSTRTPAFDACAIHPSARRSKATAPQHLVFRSNTDSILAVAGEQSGRQSERPAGLESSLCLHRVSPSFRAAAGGGQRGGWSWKLALSAMAQGGVYLPRIQEIGQHPNAHISRDSKEWTPTGHDWRAVSLKEFQSGSQTHRWGFLVLLAFPCVLGGGVSCVGLQSPMRSLWRLPVGLGSLNQTPVPSYLKAD